MITITRNHTTTITIIMMEDTKLIYRNSMQIMADVLEMWEKRGERPSPPPLGPERDEMIDLLGLKETA